MLLELIWDRGTGLRKNMCREESGTSEVDNIHGRVWVTQESEKETAELYYTEN
jgi:hypothetical protein